MESVYHQYFRVSLIHCSAGSMARIIRMKEDNKDVHEDQ